MALSKIMEFNCQFYLKNSTKSNKIIIEVTAVDQYVNHIINKTDCDKDTFLKALLAFQHLPGCDSTRSFARKSKSKSLFLLNSN